MADLAIHHLRVTVEVLTYMTLGEGAGSQIRGGLYRALQMASCAAPGGYHHPDQATLCPVCWLMAREEPVATRGKDIPRAFTLRPPEVTFRATATQFRPGDQFSFGVTLFGEALHLFPYIVLALPPMGQNGLGAAARGRFRVVSLTDCDLVTGATNVLLAPGERSLRGLPQYAVTAEQVRRTALALPSDSLTLHFLTPLRLIKDRHLVKHPDLRTILARLLERLDTLQGEYGTDKSLRSPWEHLTALASTCAVSHDRTEWVEVWSGSRRTETLTPISGFVGEATFTGDLAELREWLLWGECIQIGKDTVKGNGLYRVVR
jgi:hypothetical protein